jgi:hypothetical protein
MYAPVQVGPLDVLTWLHRKEEPDQPSWDQVLASIDQVLDARHGSVASLRCFIVSDGAAPNVRQRHEFRELVRGTPVKTAVVTTVMRDPIKRGIATSLSWFNPEFRVFRPDEAFAAVQHVTIALDGFQRVWAVLSSFQRSLRTVTLPMVARALDLPLEDESVEHRAS